MAKSSGAVELADGIIDGIENSEVAEVVVVVFACLYLGASQLGYVPVVMELNMIALAAIGAAVGVDSLYKKFRRRTK